METLSSTSLHMYYVIDVFFLASHTFDLGVYLCRDAKSQSSLVGLIAGWRGDLVCCPRYSVCSLREAL